MQKVAQWFLSVDPLAPDYPWYTPYQFAGNMPIVAIDLDGLEPLSLLTLEGRLTEPVIELLNAGFGYDKEVLSNSTWVSHLNASASRKLAFKITGEPYATVFTMSEGGVTFHDKLRYSFNNQDWLELIVHEESHRQDMSENLLFFVEYGLEGGAKQLMFLLGKYPTGHDAYRAISTEEKAYSLEALVGDLLEIETPSFNLRGGSQDVLDILNDPTMSEVEKTAAVRYIGLSFRLDRLKSTLDEINSDLNSGIENDVRSWAVDRFSEKEIQKIINSFSIGVENLKAKIENEIKEVEDELYKY